MSKSAMLRTRRRDVNVKPNRRLDRKSSRGMIYENEELRLKTININAEIERGQSDIKKLRRENEQLRKEIWCLRDEYEKLDKLLKEKDDETGSSCSSDTDSCTSCSDSEENEQSQNMENVQKTTLNNLRTEFDHLSVVTEETSAENSDKNSSSAVSPKETWNIIAPDQGYPNCGTLSSSRSTLPIDQMPKHFFAPLKTSKSYENCTETETLGLSSWSLGNTANWSPFPNTNFINFDQNPLVKPSGNTILQQQQQQQNGHDHKHSTTLSTSGFVSNLEQPISQSHNLEACKKTSTDILVKTDTFPHFSKDSSTNSFINGGNLEELLQDIETISQDILQISSHEGKLEPFAQTIGKFPADFEESRPYKSEINVVLVPKAMPLIGFDKYQNLKSSMESLDGKSFENFNSEDTELDIPGSTNHSANDQLTLTRNVPNVIDNSFLSRNNPNVQIPGSKINPNEQISRSVQNPNANISRNISNENLLISRQPNEGISKSRITSTPNELTSRHSPNLNANMSPKLIHNQNEISRSIQNQNDILTLPKTPIINNIPLTKTLLNSNDISKNESLLLSRLIVPNDSISKTQTSPTDLRPKTPKFPTDLTFTPNSDPSPNDPAIIHQVPTLQRQPSNPFFYGTFGNYSDQFSNRYNPELFAHDNFGFKNEILQQSTSKLDETDQEKLNLKTNLDNETAEKNSSQVKDAKTEIADDKSSKKEEQKSPKNRRTRKVSIYFKGKKDKLARSLSLDTKISQKNLDSLEKPQKLDVPKTPSDSTFGSQKLDPKSDAKLQESDTKTSSDSKTSIDRKHRKSSSTSPERKHVHVKLDDDKNKKGHRKRHRKSDKRPNRTNSIDRGGRERSYSVCTDRSNILDHKFGHFDEYTNSERDRSNSLSSCDTVKSRKMSAVPQFQVSGKIPWFGCWGNGCL